MDVWAKVNQIGCLLVKLFTIPIKKSLNGIKYIQLKSSFLKRHQRQSKKKIESAVPKPCLEIMFPKRALDKYVYIYIYIHIHTYVHI